MIGIKQITWKTGVLFFLVLGSEWEFGCSEKRMEGDNALAKGV